MPAPPAARDGAGTTPANPLTTERTMAAWRRRARSAESGATEFTAGVSPPDDSVPACRCTNREEDLTPRGPFPSLVQALDGQLGANRLVAVVEVIRRAIDFLVDP